MSILENPLLISLGLASGFFLFIVFIASMLYEQSLKKQRVLRSRDKSDWLFHNFSDKFYGALFGFKDPEEILPKFGVDIEEYYENCRLVDKKPNPRALVSKCVYGITAFLVSFILVLVTDIVILIIPGLIIAYYCLMGEKQALKKEAENRKYQIQDELPDFLDLLSAELAIGLPIEQAIGILASRLDNLLSKEFLWAFSAMEFGAGNWLQSLEFVAMKYNVETLNDFVSKVSVAYQKGIPIADTVAHETTDIKNAHLLQLKERAGKMTNTILIPIAVFQFLPIIAFIVIPVMLQIASI